VIILIYTPYKIHIRVFIYNKGFMNKKTILDRLAFALGVTLNQIDKVPVKPAGVDITDVNDVVVTDDTTCQPFSEYLRVMRPPFEHDADCNSTDFLKDIKGFPCISITLVESRELGPIVEFLGKEEMTLEYFRHDGPFVQGVLEGICSYVTNGIKSGCLTPNPKLMNQYRDSIKNFDTRTDPMNPSFKAPDRSKPFPVLWGLFDQFDNTPEVGKCRGCLWDNIHGLGNILDNLGKLSRGMGYQDDLKGTIFEKLDGPPNEKLFRKIWEEIIACTMDAIEPAGSV